MRKTLWLTMLIISVKRREPKRLPKPLRVPKVPNCSSFNDRSVLIWVTAELNVPVVIATTEWRMQRRRRMIHRMRFERIVFVGELGGGDAGEGFGCLVCFIQKYNIIKSDL